MELFWGLILRCVTESGKVEGILDVNIEGTWCLLWEWLAVGISVSARLGQVLVWKLLSFFLAGSYPVKQRGEDSWCGCGWGGGGGVVYGRKK